MSCYEDDLTNSRSYWRVGLICRKCRNCRNCRKNSIFQEWSENVGKLTRRADLLKFFKNSDSFMMKFRFWEFAEIAEIFKNFVFSKFSETGGTLTRREDLLKFFKNSNSFMVKFRFWEFAEIAEIFKNFFFFRNFQKT